MVWTLSTRSAFRLFARGRRQEARDRVLAVEAPEVAHERLDPGVAGPRADRLEVAAELARFERHERVAEAVGAPSLGVRKARASHDRAQRVEVDDLAAARVEAAAGALEERLLSMPRHAGHSEDDPHVTLEDREEPRGRRELGAAQRALERKAVPLAADGYARALEIEVDRSKAGELAAAQAQIGRRGDLRREGAVPAARDVLAVDLLGDVDELLELAGAPATLTRRTAGPAEPLARPPGAPRHARGPSALG